MPKPVIPQIQSRVCFIEQDQIDTYDSSNSLTDSEQILVDIVTKSHKMAVYGNHTMHPLQLANLASEITAGFITIFYFFKLYLKDFSLLTETFQRLQDALKIFPGMEELYLDLVSLIRTIKPETNRDQTYQLIEKKYHQFLAILKHPINL